LTGVLSLLGDESAAAGRARACRVSPASLKSSSWTWCHQRHAASDASSHERRRPSSHPSTTTLTVRPEIHCHLVTEQRRRAISAGLYTDVAVILAQRCCLKAERPRETNPPPSSRESNPQLLHYQATLKTIIKGTADHPRFCVHHCSVWVDLVH